MTEAVMHYTGMAAFEIAGRIVWDVPLSAIIDGEIIVTNDDGMRLVLSFR